MADVSTIPGRACAKTWYSMARGETPDPRIWEKREYWFPTVPEICSSFGFAGSVGGCSGLNAIWQDPHDRPIKNGGSMEPSRMRGMAGKSGFAGGMRSLYPAHVPSRPLFTLRHWSLLNRGFGNLRSPIAPVDVPNRKSQADCR